MTQGRPPGVPLDPDHPGPFGQEIADIDPRGRISLPVRLTSHIGWLSSDPWPKDALVTLNEPGSLLVQDFAVLGPWVLERRRALIDNVENDSGALEELAALEDRFYRTRIPETRRVSLGLAALTHLEVGDGARVYIERVADTIRILTPIARKLRLERTSTLFQDSH